MKRRSFLSTLLLPLLPVPDLPLEKPLQLGSFTGRFSCLEPNFQTIRKGLPVGKSTALAEEVIQSVVVGNVRHWNLAPISELIEKTQPMKDLSPIAGSYEVHYESNCGVIIEELDLEFENIFDVIGGGCKDL
jgi:hypothetical protein